MLVFSVISNSYVAYRTVVTFSGALLQNFLGATRVISLVYFFIRYVFSS